MKKIMGLLVVLFISLSSLSVTAQGGFGGWYPGWLWDWDFIAPKVDNCPNTFNPSQRDTDGDGIGDACDNNVPDVDWDGIVNEDDNCLFVYNPSQRDTDADGKGDACDRNWKDKDWDGIFNGPDNCKWIYNPSQLNSDGDRYGDECDCGWFSYWRGCP